MGRLIDLLLSGFWLLSGLGLMAFAGMASDEQHGGVSQPVQYAVIAAGIVCLFLASRRRG